MATYKVSDETKDNDETLQVVEKTFTPPEVVVEISVSKEIRSMENDKKDIESIVARFNAHRELYNEALTGMSSATTPIAELKVTFPVIPEVFVEVEK